MKKVQQIHTDNTQVWKFLIWNTIYVNVIYVKYIAENVTICLFTVTGSVFSCIQSQSPPFLTVTVTYVRYWFVENCHTSVLSLCICCTLFISIPTVSTSYSLFHHHCGIGLWTKGQTQFWDFLGHLVFLTQAYRYSVGIIRLSRAHSP